MCQQIRGDKLQARAISYVLASISKSEVWNRKVFAVWPMTTFILHCKCSFTQMIHVIVCMQQHEKWEMHEPL